MLPARARKGIAEIIDEEFNISFINKIEVLGHSSADGKLKEFIDSATTYNISDDIVEKTIVLRKKYTIKVPDAIIAATALVYKFTLLTRNVDDFKNIPKLDVENPWLWK